MNTTVRICTAGVMAALMAVALASISCVPQFPPLEGFLTAPYDQIVDGLKPHLPTVPTKIPTLQAGQKVAFFAASDDDKILQSFCPDKLVIRPQVPKVARTLRMLHSQGGIELEISEVSLNLAQGDSGIELEQAEVQVRSSTGSGRMTAEEHVVHQELETAAGGHRTVEQKAKVSRVLTPVSEMHTEQAFEIARIASERGWFGRLLDEDMIALLEEEKIIAGFYDSEDNLLADESVTIVALDERQQIIRMLQLGGDLADLIHRDISADYRTELQLPADAACKGKLEIESFTKAVYYGHEFGLKIVLTNTGDAPLFDATIFNELPANCEFVRFGVEAKTAAGFFPIYHESDTRKLILVKLYRPIRPGESFKIAVLLRAGAWSIPAP